MNKKAGHVLHTTRLLLWDEHIDGICRTRQTHELRQRHQGRRAGSHAALVLLLHC